MTAYFITGTDTDVGKTVVASALLKHFTTQGKSTIGFKPISAGCDITPEGLRNTDALNLLQQSSLSPTYDEVNPYAFEPPIAPHIAAGEVGELMTVDALTKAYRRIQAYQSDITIVEGAGGWCLPINDREFLYQWVKREQLDVILVVGVKLGCLNHALLTQAFIHHQGLNIVGWVANLVSPTMSNIQDNINTLKQQLSSPLLATIPYLANPDADEVIIDFTL